MPINLRFEREFAETSKILDIRLSEIRTRVANITAGRTQIQLAALSFIYATQILSIYPVTGPVSISIFGA